MSIEIECSRGTPLLATKNLTKKFGGLTPTNNLSLKIMEGQIHCIIGPNGAGKSTLFNLITGFLKPTSGEIWFMDKKISNLPPHKICQLGIGRKFQVPSVFYGVTVEDNLLMAASGKNKFFKSFQRDSQTAKDLVVNVLDWIGLTEKLHMNAEMLSHGEKQWLEIGMVLANEPKLILLDEPTAGMTNEETSSTVRLIKSIAEHVTVVVIEHDMSFIRNIAACERGKITVLNQGALLTEGRLEEISQDKRVKECYLGKKEL